MNIIAGIQARLGSTRWPKKMLHVMSDGRTMTEHVYSQVRACIPHTLMLIPNNEPEYGEYLDSVNIPFLSGDPYSPLSRYVRLSSLYNPDYIVRVTGDCPWVPRQQIKEGLSYCSEGYDFISNTGKYRTTPDGWDVEIISRELLSKLNVSPTCEEEEHVTLKAYTIRGLRRKYFGLPIDFSHIKCSVDTKEDMGKWDNE